LADRSRLAATRSGALNVSDQFEFRVGDQVRLTEGVFENFEGEVQEIDNPTGRITIGVNIYGRATPVEVEYWQIEKV
jgi:transcriptional antiterminator NusG